MTLPVFTAIVLFTIMLVIWGMYLIGYDPAIVDIGWASSIGIGAFAFFLITNNVTLIKIASLTCVLLWSGRITFLLSRRLFLGIEDRRYIALSKQFGKWKEVKYLLFFMAQGIGAYVMLIPLMYIFSSVGGEWNKYATVALVWFIIAYCGEAWADYTLIHFKQRKGKKNEICEEGLWRYSRHPNYFFEVQVWVAIALFAGATVPEGFWAFITPSILLVLILFVTGVPPTEERALEKYGEKYKVYQRKTSVFIPWFRLE